MPILHRQSFRRTHRALTGRSAAARGAACRRVAASRRRAAVRRTATSSRTALRSAAVALLASLALLAAPPRELLSPPGRTVLHLAGATVTVTYHRPKMRNPKPPHAPRLIFGPGTKYLVPFGQVWRLGANQATTLIASAPIVLAGRHLAAGTYTLFAIPDPGHWTLIISKKTGEWGIPYPGRQFDLARETIPAHHTARKIDPFTISFRRTGSHSAQLRFAWDHTMAAASLRVE